MPRLEILARLINSLVDPDLQAHVLGLEQEMHRTETRRNSARMDELLHEDFREIGRSGRTYSRQEILDELSGESTLPDIGVTDVSCSSVDDETVLLTYTSYHQNQLKDGEQGSRYTLRASLWVRQAGRWRLRFHQGTPKG